MRTLQGSLTLKAFRLTAASMEMFKKKEFSSATCVFLFVFLSSSSSSSSSFFELINFNFYFNPQNIKHSVKALKLTYDTILEEVPLVVKTSHLSRALLDELDRELKKSYVSFFFCAHFFSSFFLTPTSSSTQTFDRLDLNTQSFLEKNVRFLMDCVDELSTCVSFSFLFFFFVPY